MGSEFFSLKVKCIPHSLDGLSHSFLPQNQRGGHGAGEQTLTTSLQHSVSATPSLLLRGGVFSSLCRFHITLHRTPDCPRLATNGECVFTPTSTPARVRCTNRLGGEPFPIRPPTGTGSGHSSHAASVRSPSDSSARAAGGGEGEAWASIINADQETSFSPPST